MVMQQFGHAVEEIESMTKSFIEQSFQKLRSAEGAFELVQNFKNIQVLPLLPYTICSFVVTHCSACTLTVWLLVLLCLTITSHWSCTRISVQLQQTV
jgi:hypothetical protein